ncbi:MAG TPA: PP2C family protein-serine/threonine phosphatase [Anaerolineales bacterium]|nr:PP2C family protein-serine/threonine phosphatase [Anaerolineales bacterium]
MQTSVINLIREGLLEKKENLEQWQTATQQSEKQIDLGFADESAVQAELELIDVSLQKMETGEYGICKVCHDTVDAELLQMDFTATVCLGHFTEDELRQLESELELSQVIQRALLPQQVPTLSGYDIAAFSRPAQIVTGDYFDFLQLDDGTHGLVVGDVSGHGVAAGMLMTNLQTVFHTLAPETDSPVDVLKRINRLYVHNINFSTFVTLFFAKLDPHARTLSYASAGHNPPLLYRSSTSESAWLKPTGAAIGLMADYRIRSESLQLMEGDVLLLYTDGVIEAINPQGTEQFGYDRLLDIVQQNAGSSASQLIQNIRQALNDFTQGSLLADDITLVICKVN